MAQLTISRRKTYNAALRSAAILIDGHKVGEVGNGGVCTIEVPDGDHEVRARIDWYNSKPLAFTAVPGGVLAAEVRFCPSWQALFGVLGLTRYIWLEPVG